MDKNPNDHLRFVNVHKDKTPELLREIANFWTTLKVLPEKTANETAHQALFLVRDDDHR